MVVGGRRFEFYYPNFNLEASFIEAFIISKLVYEKKYMFYHSVSI